MKIIRFPGEILTFSVPFLAAAFREESANSWWSSRRTFTFSKITEVKQLLFSQSIHTACQIHLPKMPLWSFIFILRTPTGSLLPIRSVWVIKVLALGPLSFLWHGTCFLLGIFPSRRLCFLAPCLVLALICVLKDRFRNPACSAEHLLPSDLLSFHSPHCTYWLHHTAQHLVRFCSTTLVIPSVQCLPSWLLPPLKALYSARQVINTFKLN